MEITRKDIRTAYQEGIFKIFIKRSFFLIRVFETQQDMVYHVNDKYSTSKINSDVAGVFYPTYEWVNKKGSLRLTRCLGEIYLNLEFMKDSVVQHECTHAAFAYIRRIICRRRGMKEYIKGVQIDKKKEELLCHLASLFTCLVMDTFGR